MTQSPGNSTIPGIGAAIDRIEGIAKVTGQARYAAEHPSEALLYGVAVCAGVARGRIQSLDIADAMKTPGVVQVLTHENRPHVPWYETTEDDDTAGNAKPPVPLLLNDVIMYSGQPIALVVAETFEAARQGAMQVEAAYETQPHNTLLDTALVQRFTPADKAQGNIVRGDTHTALAESAARIDCRYELAMEHHNPMEMHATTVQWHGEGRLTVYDKNQGSQNAQRQLAQAFGLDSDSIEVANHHVGGAFGSGLRPGYQAYLAMLAALMLKRSVRVVMTRQQMFTHVHRPAAMQDMHLACDTRGRLQAMEVTATTSTARIETYTENLVKWGAIAYPSDHVRLDYAVAPIDTPTPGNMRAPGAATGVNLLEMALDELAYANGMDPLALRLVNCSDVDGITGHPFTSKALKKAYEAGAERFGWDRRSLEPRSMRKGKELMGWGMATGIWEALVLHASATATLDVGGILTVRSAASDIGTGTYTIMAQIAAGALGLPLDRVRVEIGESGLPDSPFAGGSAMAASVGAAVHRACKGVARQLSDRAGGRSRDIDLGQLAAQAPDGRIECSATVEPPQEDGKARNTHSAVFAEVCVDERLGVVRVTRLLASVAAGRIINPKTARSQVLGGLVMGMGMALQEEALFDHRLGRIMNHNLAEYHIPCHADVHDMEVIFVDEPDGQTSPLGVKGVGEIGIVGTAAAIANALYHATGKRIRTLPITLDKLL